MDGRIDLEDTVLSPIAVMDAGMSEVHIRQFNRNGTIQTVTMDVEDVPDLIKALFTIMGYIHYNEQGR